MRHLGGCNAVEDAHGSRQRQNHIVSRYAESPSHLARSALRQHAPALHDDHLIGMGKHVLQPMLGNDDGRAQLEVYLANRVQEVRGGNGVQLACRLIQNKHLGLHSHNGSQTQQLLLPARKILDIFVEPLLNAEVACHLGHTQAHDALVDTQAFKTESQLMPHPVGDHLSLRVLHDEPYLGRLLGLRDIIKGHAPEQHATAAPAMRRKHRLQVTQQRGLPATALPAQHHIAAALDFKRHIRKRRPGRALADARVRERQILDSEMRHARASFALTISGKARKAA